jgi:uncharacterized membrane protein
MSFFIVFMLLMSLLILASETVCKANSKFCEAPEDKDETLLLQTMVKVSEHSVGNEETSIVAHAKLEKANPETMDERPVTVMVIAVDKDADYIQGRLEHLMTYQVFHAMSRVFLSTGTGKSSVIYSVALTFAAQTLIPLGLTLYKLSQKMNDYTVSVGIWVAGFIVSLIGHLIGWVALGSGPQSILSGLSSWSLIMAFFYGVVLVGEKTRVDRLLSCVVMISGILVLISVLPEAVKAPTATELLTRACSSDVIVCLLVLCAAAAVIAVFSSVGIRYATAAAVLTWFSTVFAKGIAGIVLSGSATSGIVWLAVVVGLVVGLSNVFFINKAFQYTEVTQAVPFYEALALSGQAVVGGVFFQEFHFDSPTRILLLFSGLTLILGGLISMAATDLGHSVEAKGQQSATDLGNSVEATGQQSDKT